MTARTDPPAADNSADGEPRPSKPRFSLFLATAGGLGYLPKAPGTWGSLAGVLIYAVIRKQFHGGPATKWISVVGLNLQMPIFLACIAAIAVAFVGVWVSTRVARYTGIQDPQFIVIDEVSGQMFTYLFALAPANWKYLLLGLILFRVFDIWKPFPARQAESLPGGWGIMADDWIAGVYAAICLWLARAAGL
jgi:phosphatidylglycerophosphatase A